MDVHTTPGLQVPSLSLCPQPAPSPAQMRCLDVRVLHLVPLNQDDGDEIAFIRSN